MTRCHLRASSARAAALVLAAVLFGAAGCNQKMNNGPRYKPLAESDFFEDAQSARPQVPGTVARGHLRAEQAFYTGRSNGALTDTFPIPVTRDVLTRGRERFDIFCSPCHSRLGDGDGVVVERGFRRPASFHADRLRAAPVGHFYDVVTNGIGAMTSYASRVPPADRWAIAAYIRALQLSQLASISDVPPSERQRLMGSH